MQLTTTGGAVSIAVNQAGTGNAGAFQLINNGSSINGNPASPLTLDGNSAATSGIAILVNPAAADSGSRSASPTSPSATRAATASASATAR